MKTLRQQIVEEVHARFATIRKSAGYATDIGEHVFLWRTVPLAQDDLPAVVLRDRQCQTQLEGRMVHEHRLTFEADLYTGGPTAAAEDIRAALGDAMQAIGKDVTWKLAGARLAVDTEPLDDVIDVAHEERLVGGARFRFVIRYRTRPFDPYSPLNA